MVNPYMTICVWIIVPYFLSCTIAKIWRIIGQIFAINEDPLHDDIYKGEPVNLVFQNVGLRNIVLWCGVKHI